MPGVAEPRQTLAEIGARIFETVEPGVCYRLRAPNILVEFEVDRLTWRREELTGELLVRCDLAGTDGIDGVLSVASFNVSSSRARSERASQLERQSRARDLPWHPLVEELCQRVLAAERSGEPAVALRDVFPQAADARTVSLSGFLLPMRHPSILFGDGGACKSYLALYLGGLMAREGYRVLLADWELDADDHRERFGRLFGTEMPATFFYTRCARPLLHDVDRLKRIVRQQGIDYCVLDSIGFACHEAPEAAESALGYFRSVRALGVGSLNLAHISKAEGGDAKPFGSVFHFNSARAVWNIKATEDATGALTLGIFDRKPSLRARQQPFALSVTFGADRTTFTRTEISESDAFAPQLTLNHRIRALLKGGALTRDEIATELDCKPDTVRRTVARAIQGGYLVRVPGPDGTERIGLMARTA